jgi:uncharacterized metal-binding protein
MNPPTGDKTPIFLSALVYPGAGQFLQRRWLVGLFYSVTFTILFVLLLSAVLKPLMGTLDAAFRWAAQQENRPFQTISAVRVIVLFVGLIMVYVANLTDVVRASRRRLQPPPLAPNARK